jgi:hypothetical protein
MSVLLFLAPSFYVGASPRIRQACGQPFGWKCLVTFFFFSIAPCVVTGIQTSKQGSLSCFTQMTISPPTFSQSGLLVLRIR